jgi:hypothetical protein
MAERHGVAVKAQFEGIGFAVISKGNAIMPDNLGGKC